MANSISNKVPVSKRAIEARIKRSLKGEGVSLKRNRSARYAEDLGDLYTVDDSSNSVIGAHHTLQSLAEAQGVLKPWEVIDDD
jgi:hypothetical protein